MASRLHQRCLRAGEIASYCAATVLLGFFIVQLAQGEVERREAVDAFERHANITAAATEDHAVVAPADTSVTLDPAFDYADPPDMSLWSPGRIADYEESLAAELPAALGILELPAVGLEVPVYPEASDLTMDRAAGVIRGMAYPHEEGNIGISGHRDGYFRALKDVEIGDQIVLQTRDGEKRFIIQDTTVVEKNDTRLLQDTREQTVTLVTCYPFYFAGPAPQRFIVTASLDTNDVN